MTDASAAPTAPIPRINSVDLLRGLVIVLMAMDHARAVWTFEGYPPLDVDRTHLAYFLSRWLTHFCAPAFVFLTGVSAWLHARNKNLSKAALSGFLVTRGLWLIVIEATIISFSWGYDFSWITFQVLFAIGASMIVLAGLIHLPRAVVAVVGLALVVGHNALDPINAADFGGLSWVWAMLHEGGQARWADGGVWQGVWFVYPLIPWIGVIALGWAAAPLFALPAAQRDVVFLALGLAATTAFVVLRFLNGYGEPTAWAPHDRGPLFTLMAFVKTTKYPPSLMFLLMTLGPSLMLIPLLERWRGFGSDVVRVFGKAPFLFYVLHIPLIHGAAEFKWWLVARDHEDFRYWNPSTWPEGYASPLWHGLLVTAIVLALLYPVCRWFVNYRRTHAQWWLSYL